eukprot:CAMPEP_0197484610 /NCGR_PEP_ID=MMETSP1309-20131121/57491_1 /TAXON_ID=464262 /ORGANISM="Genus nov. species nov., Strain RCC998" /LENGTH=391 /DNA_ID=CAMNT_0043027253 /DNA_START=55 /DNA_END=1230 /DNA_ORIENTATION=-
MTCKVSPRLRSSVELVQQQQVKKHKKKKGLGRRVTVTAARNSGSFGDARSRLSKLRPEQGGQGREKRKDQGYLRVDENLLKNETLDVTKLKDRKPVEERRFRDKLAKESSEFIWNSNWKKDLDNWEKASSSSSGASGTTPTTTAASGSSTTLDKSSEMPPPGRGISFSRVSELNDLSVDLSEQLRPREETAEEESASTSGVRRTRRDFLDFPERVNTSDSFGYSKGSKFSRSAVDESIIRADPANTAEASRQYSETKAELFVYTFLTGLVTGGLCYNLYGEDVAISYGVGCLASLFYLRLLSRTVDSVASEDAAAQVGGAGGQARLLVPAILVLGYSKGNQSVIDNYGVHLNIIAILAGFFTYKAGTFGQVLKSTVILMAGDKEAKQKEDS